MPNREACSRAAIGRFFSWFDKIENWNLLITLTLIGDRGARLAWALDIPLVT